LTHNQQVRCGVTFLELFLESILYFWSISHSHNFRNCYFYRWLACTANR
jgi:hypothetical protein